jgi:predicted dienelactone hydrolase
MTLPRLWPAFACLVMAMPLAAQTPGPAAPAVSVRQASVADPGYNSIPVAIWSPAGGTALPLIVISHGTGAGLLSHVDTAQALAEAGFVVVALMHPGDNFRDDSRVGRPDWFAHRSRHVAKAIDFMFGAWEGRARLLPDRVGIFGFSAGATTALISVGGAPNLGGVAAHCARAPEFVCGLMAPPGTNPDFGPASLVHDRRIAAAVIAAPGLGFAFAPDGLAGVRVPVQLWTGDADRTVPSETNANVVRRLLRGPVDFHRVAGAVHLSFLAPCGPESPPQICQDGEGFDRAAFHETLNRTMIAFFRRHLAGPARARRR